MSYKIFGDEHDQPWPSHWSRQRNLANAPFSFNNRKPRMHRHQPSNYFPTSPLQSQPTTDMLTEQYTVISGRNGSKAKFRFHGGIGDGRGGLSCRIPKENTSPQPLKLFDELNPIDMLIEVPRAGFSGNHVTRATALHVKASNGTGVFLPVYPKKIRSKEGMPRGNDGCWNGIRDVGKGKECAEEEAIPMELMLSGQTSHVM